MLATPTADPRTYRLERHGKRESTMTLRVLSALPEVRILQLCDYGQVIGEGTLHRCEDGGWMGYCSEWTGSHQVEGDAGLTRLEFSKPRDASQP